MALFWLVLGIALLLFELHHMAFYAMFVAIGCFAAAAIALVGPGVVVLQLVGLVVVAGIGVLALRPFMSRKFHVHDGGKVASGVHGGLIGEDAFTVDQVSDVMAVGHVKLSGERWLAITSDGSVVPAGRRVTVTDIRGTTLVVVAGADQVSTQPGSTV